MPPMYSCFLTIAVLAHACGLAVSLLTLFLKALLNPDSKPRLLLSDLQKQVTLYPMLQGQYKLFNNLERVSFFPRSTFSHYPRDIKKRKRMLFTLIFFALSRIQSLVLLQRQELVPTHPTGFPEA